MSETAEQSIGKIGNVGGVSSQVTSHFPIVREISGDVTGTLTLTNGAQKFSARIVVDGNDTSRTLVFEGACPPRDEEFWIVEVTELAMIPIPAAKQRRDGSLFPDLKLGFQTVTWRFRRGARSAGCLPGSFF